MSCSITDSHSLNDKLSLDASAYGRYPTPCRRLSMSAPRQADPTADVLQAIDHHVASCQRRHYFLLSIHARTWRRSSPKGTKPPSSKVRLKTRRSNLGARQTSGPLPP